MEERKEEVMDLVKKIQNIFESSSPISFDMDEKGCVINVRVGEKNLCMVTEWHDENWYCASSKEKIDHRWFDERIKKENQPESIKYILENIDRCGIKALTEKVMYVVATPDSEVLSDVLGTCYIDSFNAKELPILVKEFAVNEFIEAKNQTKTVPINIER